MSSVRNFRRQVAVPDTSGATFLPHVPPVIPSPLLLMHVTFFVRLSSRNRRSSHESSPVSRITFLLLTGVPPLHLRSQARRPPNLDEATHHPNNEPDRNPVN